MNTIPQQQRLFRKFRSGEMGALTQLVDAERFFLYDYLLRMTGQISRSVEVIDDVLQSLTEDQLSGLSDPLSLRFLLFSLSRAQVLNIWNANTDQLVNAALSEDRKTSSRKEREQKELQAFRALDHALRTLPGLEREVVVLRVRFLFDFSDIAELVKSSSDEIEKVFMVGMQKIDAECSQSVIGPESALARMPLHPLPEKLSQATVNLSMVMEGIKVKPVGLRSPGKSFMMGVIFILTFSYFLFPEIFRSGAVTLFRAMGFDP